jgi:hypothetical protein
MSVADFKWSNIFDRADSRMEIYALTSFMEKYKELKMKFGK